MKKLLIATILLAVTLGTFAQKKHVNKRQQKIKSAFARYRDKHQGK